MKNLLLVVFALSIVFSSCITNETPDNNPRGNLEALWKIMDEHYCFFSQKGIDWNAVHAKYSVQINNSLSERQQFEIMANMLSELRDGHVNLYTAFDIARYWAWRENYPKNFSDSLLRRYLKNDYFLASGMDYTILDDNIGYLRCASFQRGIGSSNLNEIMLYLQPCRGLIVDIRNNGGGSISNAEELAARFTNESLLVGYMQHKTGRGHDDFSPMQQQILHPGHGIRWQKPVVVLTNRSVFSAANEFVKYMKCFPNVRVVGDRTGGGSGMPFSSELPNGWGVRFSACPMFDRTGALTEFGIDPDYKLNLLQKDFLLGRDTMIEFARKLLVSNEY